jgi:hypothetical protein
MAVTPIQEVLVQPQGIGEVFLSAITYITPSTAYVTGTGYTVSARAFGMLSLRAVWMGSEVDTTKAYIGHPCLTAKSGGVTSFVLLIAVESTGAEYGGGAAVEGLYFRLVALGN